MIVTLLMVAGILFIALLLEDKFKLPSPLGLIGLSFISHFIFQQVPVLTQDEHGFATLVIFLLPVLLISDSLELKLADLKEHALSLFYLTVVAVVLSVLIAIPIANWLFADYQLSIAAVIVMFTMVLATDPVSVVSIFSKFDLPHRLKVLAEGESLFNDATALIIFVFIGLYAMNGGEVTFSYVTEISIEVVFGSITIGVLIGFLGLTVLKTTENRTAEMMVLIMTGYGSFELAEHLYVILNLFGGHSHLHLSGILACIFATITVHHVMNQSIANEEAELQVVETTLIKQASNNRRSSQGVGRLFDRIKATIEERERHLRTKEDIQLLALVANTILFVAMAGMIDIQLLWKYKFEILSMFLATTFLRGLMIAVFAWISNQSNKMVSINFRWWSVLTFAGIKGGLSIVMLTMIPANFEHLEMFKAVTIGVILLSTFIYASVLLLIIDLNKSHFAAEKRRSIKQTELSK